MVISTTNLNHSPSAVSVYIYIYLGMPVPLPWSQCPSSNDDLAWVPSVPTNPRDPTHHRTSGWMIFSGVQLITETKPFSVSVSWDLVGLQGGGFLQIISTIRKSLLQPLPGIFWRTGYHYHQFISIPYDS